MPRWGCCGRSGKNNRSHDAAELAEELRIIRQDSGGMSNISTTSTPLGSPPPVYDAAFDSDTSGRNSAHSESWQMLDMPGDRDSFDIGQLHELHSLEFEVPLRSSQRPRGSIGRIPSQHERNAGWADHMTATVGALASNVTTASPDSGSNGTRSSRSMSAADLATVFPTAPAELIEAIVDSNDGNFDVSLDKMLEIWATPRSQPKLPKVFEAPKLELMTEDILWLVLRQLKTAQIATVAATSAQLASLIDSGQSRGMIPPRVPRNMAHLALNGPRGYAMLSALSTVLITVVDTVSRQLLSIASGTVVRGPDHICYILTSEHNLKSKKGSFDATAANPTCSVLVAINDSVSLAPKHRFRAMLHPACIDSQRDLCVLHLVEVITATPERGVMRLHPDGRKKLVPQIDFRSVSEIPGGALYGLLHSVAIGDPQAVGLGDRLCVFGYPISGEESITMSEATASGFIAQPGNEAETDWIKLHGNLDNGFSGGPVVHEASGELMGVVSHTRSHVDFARAAALAAPLLIAATEVTRDGGGQRTLYNDLQLDALNATPSPPTNP